MYRNTNDYSFARKKREKKRHRKRLFVVAVLAVIGGLFVFMQSDSNEQVATIQTEDIIPQPLGEYIQNVDEPHPLQQVEFPEEGVYAVGSLYEGTIKTNESPEPIPMASITKVITALVVLDKAPITPGEQGDTITLEQKDEDYYWKYASLLGTITDVTAGEQMSQYDILQTMLLASSNNMSDTLVDHYFGSVDAYVEQANAYLLREGFSKTTVVDATGFEPGSVSTPSELIHVGQLALRNPIIAEIARKKEASMPIAGTVPNYNVLIDEPHVTGLKPGFTDEAGSTLLFSADVPVNDGTKSVIAVAMNHQKKLTFYQDTKSILDQMRSIYAN